MGVSTCTISSLQVNEPLAGTAIDSVDLWFLLEVNDPWAPKPLETEALPTAARAQLKIWLQAPRSRLQLIRRPGRVGRRPLFMVVSASGRVAQLELDRHEDLADLELEAIPTEAAEPLVLVCVHGRRDRCCAQYGSAAYRSLQSRIGDLWQTSHLGGHRFAACVLSLPDGLMYGRMRPEHADVFVSAFHAGEIADLDLFRGRCRYDRPTQAAEIFLRRHTGEAAIDAIEWLGTTREGDATWSASFRAKDGDHTVRVHREGIGVKQPASCGGEPEPVTRFVEV
jgi:hypothetical protein